MAEAWFQDEPELERLAREALSPQALEDGSARTMRRDLLTRALSQRPLLGQSWQLPELAAGTDDPAVLHAVIDDLTWALARQADALLALTAPEHEVFGSGRAPVEERALWDDEIVVREREIERLREARRDLGERLAELRGRLEETQRELRHREQHGALTHSRRRTLPASARRAVRRLAPGAAKRAWRRVAGRAGRRR